MAKIIGSQSIPAEYLQAYKSVATLALPDGTVRKRYPFRRLQYQAGGGKVSPAAQSQRDRFLEAKQLFSTLTSSERSRWYDSPPNSDSYSWYYNYFIASQLTGNADISNGGAGVVKSCHTFSFVMKKAPTYQTILELDIDYSKTIFLVQGSSYILANIDGKIISIPDVPHYYGRLAGYMLFGWLQMSYGEFYTPAAPVSVCIVEFV